MRTSEFDLMKGDMFTKTLGKRPRSLWTHSKRVGIHLHTWLYHWGI